MVRHAGKWCVVVGCVAAVLALRLGQGEKSPEPQRPAVSAWDSLVVAGGGQEGEREEQRFAGTSHTRECAPTPQGSESVVTTPPTGKESTLRGSQLAQAPEECGSSGSRAVATNWLDLARNGELELMEETREGKAQEYKGGTAAAAVLDLRSPLYVAEVLARHNGEIQECYRQRVKINPMLEGSLDLRFVVSPEGNVSSVTVIASTLGDEELERALVNCMLSWSDFGRCPAGTPPRTYRQRYTFGVENK